MRVLVQRVTQASCTVHQTITGSIQNGFLLLVGFTDTDTLADVEHLAKKVAHLRVFEDESGKLNINILDKQYAILSISQFTLYGDASKGHRPSFTKAMAPVQAEQLYKQFNSILRNTYHLQVEEGAFGEHMSITLVNDGPVTILLER